MNIVQKDWPWPHDLTERRDTKYICIHHTAGPQNQDTQSIWDEHINIGDDGIAYHRIIKGDGTTVQGRPDDTIGAHAYGVNQISIGIVLEGNFQGIDTPTDAQISALKDNIADLLVMYPGAKIIGHRDVADITGHPDYATACPGDTLYAMLPELQP